MGLIPLKEKANIKTGMDWTAGLFAPLCAFKCFITQWLNSLYGLL
jgi:hypothetical protein